MTALVDIPGYTTGTWEIDLLHSDVSFAVRHLGLTRYRRSFEKFGGQIVTANDPLESSVNAFIDVTSFDTGLEKFNQHLLADQFLDAENHPTAAFSASTTIDRSDFGITFDATLSNDTPIVGKKVQILLEIEAILAD